jgi:hypothetical protein
MKYIYIGTVKQETEGLIPKICAKRRRHFYSSPNSTEVAIGRIKKQLRCNEGQYYVYITLSLNVHRIWMSIGRPKIRWNAILTMSIGRSKFLAQSIR